MDVYYCGFNGFRQVPASAQSDTLTCLTPHTKASKKVVDVAICWNYLVVAESDAVTKYGLVKTKPGLDKLDNPPGNVNMKQLSATPRHLLSVTDSGECWTHEEGKGWRRVLVETEQPQSAESTQSDETVTTVIEELDKELEEEGKEGEAECKDKESRLIEVLEEEEKSDTVKEDTGQVALSSVVALDTSADEGREGMSSTPDNEEVPICMVKTACGDYHNIGLDSSGQAYSLPSPLSFSSFPSGAQHKVTDIACGKEHCMLLTEHGQVYSWGGGTRGQLGHGTLASEETPRLIMALDGMRVRKISAGGWHSAVISEFDDLYMFGWNESGQLAQPTNLVRPAECFSAVEKLLMACCTMQGEDCHNFPRGDTEDTEVYRKRDEVEPVAEIPDPEKEALNCYTAASCDTPTDLVMVQPLPMLVSISGKTSSESAVVDVGCGSRHTVALTKGNQLWSFGWNKYGQLGLGDTRSRDHVEKVPLPKALLRGMDVKMLRCGDWGTAVVVAASK